MDRVCRILYHNDRKKNKVFVKKTNLVCDGNNLANGSRDRLFPVIEGDNHSALLKKHDASNKTVDYFPLPVEKHFYIKVLTKS